MRGKYAMVRVRQGTLARLQSAVASLVDAMERGFVRDERTNVDNPNPDGLAVTMDAFINRMLDAREKHKRRVKAARERKRVRVASVLFPHEGKV